MSFKHTISHFILSCYICFFSIGQLSAAGIIDLPKMLSGSDLNQFEGFDLKNAGSDASYLQTARSFIDNSIDQDAYSIGMGDVFTVSIIEIPSISYTAIVNQNCDIYISELGLLKLGKISLRKALSEISVFVKTKLKSTNTIYVSLKEGKKVSVSVNGSILNPGTYITEGIMRIEDCILKANKMELPLLDEVDFRDVVVTRIDTTLHLDLFRYKSLNDLSQNPYVYPGDRIFIKPSTNRVYIMGELVKPIEGFVPVKPGETLSDLLPLITCTGSVDMSYIVVQKGGTNNTRATTIFTSQNADQCALENMDIITFTQKANYPDHITVTVSGAINRPGIFPVVNTQTTIRELMTLCGGYRENADVKRGYIIRNEKSFNPVTTEETEKLAVKKTNLVTPGSVRPELNLSLSRLNTFHDYTLIPFSDESQNISLESGDHIYIPFTESYVYVSGCVKNPGAYPYIEGNNYTDYIIQAGGFSSKSDRANTYILTRVHTALQIRSGTNVFPGDIVVVPDSQNNKTMITLILPLLQIISTAVTVVIAINSLR